MFTDTATITVIIPTCPSPFGVSALPAGPGGISLSWDTLGTGIGTASYEIDYGPIGYTAGTGTRVPIPSALSASSSAFIRIPVSGVFSSWET